MSDRPFYGVSDRLDRWRSALTDEDAIRPVVTAVEIVPFVLAYLYAIIAYGFLFGLGLG